MKFLLALGALLTHLVTGGQMWPFPGPGSKASHVAAPVTQVFPFGVGSALTATSAGMFSFPVGVPSTASTTETDHQAIVLAGTISNLHVTLSGDVGGAGALATFTLRKNLTTDLAVTCTVTGAVGTQATCDSGVLTDTVAEGDTLSMKVVTTSASAVTPQWTWKWVGTNGDESMLIGRYNAANGSTGTSCFHMSGSQVSQGAGACANPGTHMLFPEAFTATKLFVRAPADIGADGVSRVFTVRKDGVDDTSLQTTITGVGSTAQANSDVSGSVPYAATHALDVEDVATGTVLTGFYAVTIALTSTTQSFVGASCNSASANQSVVNYARPTSAQSWSGTDGARANPILGFTLTGIANRVYYPPGTGKTWTVAFRDFTSTTDLMSCVIGSIDGAVDKTCAATGSVAVTADHQVEWSILPSAGTPTAHADYCMTFAGHGT